MDVLVTGANGFLGSHLVDTLLAAGHGVTCLLRPSSDPRWLTDPRLRILRHRMTGPDDTLSEAMSGRDVVYHVAGAIKAASLQDFMRQNANLTETLVRACLAASPMPRRMVVVSSVAALGPGENGGPVRDAQTPRPVTDYGRSKREAECRAVSLAGPMEVVVVRPGALYGPRDREFLPAFRLARLGLVPLLAGRGQNHNLCHVADAVAAIVLAGEMPAVSGMAFLIGGPQEHTMEEIGRVLCDLFGRKPTYLPVPRIALEAVALGADAWAWLTGEPAMISRQKLPELTGDWRFDISPACHRLGYKPRWDIAEGFAMTLEWYRKEGWL